jgi:hypothetical protein
MSDGIENIPDSRGVWIGVEKSSDIFRYIISLVQDSSQV